MKKLIMIYLAAIFVITAGAQNIRKITIEEFHNKPKPQGVPLAHKPMVLHTGNLLTIVEKRDLLTKFRTSAQPVGARPRQSQTANAPETLTITPRAMSMKGFGAYGLDIQWYPDNGEIYLQPTEDHQIGLYYEGAIVNTAYVVTVKVEAQASQFYIVPFTPNNTVAVTTMAPQTVTITAPPNGQPYKETEFAFAFDASSSGPVRFSIYSTGLWMFKGAELMTEPM
jgi:hypothetical protein